MPCHHVQHTQNVGPNLFARNVNIAYVMPRVMHALRSMRTQASHPPYVYVVCQELLMDVPFVQAK